MIAVAAFAVISLVGMFIVTWGIAKRIYADKFVRTSPDKWQRENSCPDNPEHCVMYDMGLEWGERHKDSIKELTVTSEDGLKLVGQYFDFGFDRCAMIFPGRAEAVKYCYFFAPPYEKAGYNIFVADTRAHGLSEGKYVGFAVLESRDILCWARLINERFGIENIVIHGVCVGGAASVLALSAPDCPPYIKKLVTEGLYTDFYDVLKQRTRLEGKPTFPVVAELALLAKRNAGVDVFRDKPINRIPFVKAPMLFLQGRQDKSSLPKRCEMLYDACGSEDKRIVWFDKGAHSHLRINNMEEYDRAVTDFIKE